MAPHEFFAKTGSVSQPRLTVQLSIFVDSFEGVIVGTLVVALLVLAY